MPVRPRLRLESVDWRKIAVTLTIQPTPVYTRVHARRQKILSSSKLVDGSIGSDACRALCCPGRSLVVPIASDAVVLDKSALHSLTDYSAPARAKLGRAIVFGNAGELVFRAMEIEEFATLYKAKTDEELVRLAVDWAQLTSDAHTALENELARRQIEVVKLSQDHSQERTHHSSSRERPARMWADSELVVSTLRYLKFGCLLLINLAVAVVGTVTLELATIGKLLQPHSIASVIWKESILSGICAAAIGFGMWRTWRNSATKWIWVLAAAWFMFGLAVAGRGVVLGRINVLGGNLGPAEVRSYFAFTVPLIRSICFSLGAEIASRFYPPNTYSEQTTRRETQIITQG